MLELKLSEIYGIHPGFTRIERELDLAPTRLPDRALIPEPVLPLITTFYPLVISEKETQFCIGQTTLYRWLVAYAAPQTRVLCRVFPTRLTEATLHQLVLIERLVAPGLAQITPQQVRDLYAHIGSAAEQWPNGYRSHAHLARMLGVKPIKVQEAEQ